MLKQYELKMPKEVFSGENALSHIADLVKQGKAKEINDIRDETDLDGLKNINDTYGHDVGDTAICYIADVLIKSCHNHEVFCRFGGDEFIVYAADCDEERAEKITDEIRSNIAKINASGSNPFVLSASIGHVIAIPEENEDIFDFVNKADKVMYEEKKRKKHHK